MHNFTKSALCCGLFINVLGKVYSQQGKVQQQAVKDSAKALKEVVLTAQKSNYTEYHIDKVVLNVSGLIGITGGNAVDILNNAPGVFVDENGGISLKGRGGVIIYVDDKPLQLSGADAINYLKSLPVAMIDKIELMSNPSAKYNADGTAVINIRTKKNKANGFNGSVSLSAGYGRYFKSNNSVLLNYKVNRLNFFMSAGFSSSNVYFESFRQRHYNYPQLAYSLLQRVNETNHERSANYKLGVDYTAGKHTTIGLLYNGFVAPYKEMGRYNNHFYDPSGSLDSFTLSGSRYTITPNRNAVNLNLRHLFANTAKEIDLNFDYLRYANQPQQTLISEFFLPAHSFVKQSTFITQLPFNAVIYSAKADYSDTLFGNIRIEPGVQTIYSVRSNSAGYFTRANNILQPDEFMINKFRYRENIQSAYINMQGRFNRLLVQAGLRVEHTEGNAMQYDMPLKPDTMFTMQYTNLFPTAYFTYKADSSGKNIVSFSIGKRIERPGYYDLNPSSFYFDRNTSNIGNSLLQPAFSTNMELLYNYRGKLITGFSFNNTKGHITPAYKQVNDAFIRLPLNIQRYISYGVSVTWQPAITHWWNLNLNSELINNSYKGNAVPDEGKKSNEGLTTFFIRTYNRFTFPKGWSADATFFYRTRYIAWQALLRSIWQVHGGIQKKINEKATLTVAARDIFHSWRIRRDVYIPYGRVYYDLENDTQRMDITFSYRFGKSTGNKERKTGIDAESRRVN